MSYNNGTVSEKKYNELGSVEREKKNYLQKAMRIGIENTNNEKI